MTMKKHEKINGVDVLSDKFKSEKCDITKEQFREAASEIMDRELSLDDLNEVSGGCFPGGNN